MFRFHLPITASRASDHPNLIEDAKEEWTEPIGQYALRHVDCQPARRSDCSRRRDDLAWRATRPGA